MSLLEDPLGLMNQRQIYSLLGKRNRTSQGNLSLEVSEQGAALLTFHYPIMCNFFLHVIGVLCKLNFYGSISFTEILNEYIQHI